ncbi:MAG TPA: PstS family phosphate ABC transporter substrate-binding protein [Vitreimonas sp.]|uniref:PstS family phosphate ABC transporter substrate-binding protein n=1 Tax=Vitreimonas sp. TaxID=3069702 RepID=UPI002D730C1D|nr:PstS family phosphate ABC transporter substrate-binding protein [Vitreimonas sp.]HYD86151.1 PstS family phosphate ABC transporter substrate-binding protein [Vitreimonas sp.]
MQNSLRATFAAAALVALAACGDNAQRQSAGAGAEAIQIDGSSTVFPLSEAVAEAFSAAATGGARVTVGESGTGGGFRKFCRGETQVQGASRPITAEEMAACAAANVTYVELPIAFDGISVVVNNANPATAITLAELRRAWEPAAERTVTTWRQINPSWPATPLLLFGPGTASGTFDYFTQAVNGDEGASRTDYTPSEDDNVIVQGVTTNPGAMGYFGYAYYDQNRERLKALSVDGVAPSPETIANGTYPLARPIFIYVNAEALQRPQVQRFAQYYVANAGRLAQQVGYVGLSESAYQTLATRVRERQAGTAFGGENEVGVNLAEVLARPLSTAAPAAAE